MLRLDDRWIWDFWLARAGSDYHVFYLQAPRALGDPQLRHTHASVGHAVSVDLRSWRVLPDALHAGPPGTWDSTAIWTGSVVRCARRWALAYTGMRLVDGVARQQIGVAFSDDLVTWHKHPGNPVLTPDARLYEVFDAEGWADEVWRDPHVVADPDGDGFHAFFSARAREGPPDGRGVIGHARSQDLLHWRVLPPVTRPGDFADLECPQAVTLDGRHYLLFSVSATRHAAARLRRVPAGAVTGTHYLVGDSLTGPYRMTSDDFLVTGPAGPLYAGRLADDPRGGVAYLAWRNETPGGSFVGELSDPMPVVVHRDGRLDVTYTPG